MKKGIVIVLCFFLCFYCFGFYESYANSGLKIHYIDVGSGDAIYIEADGETMLIDGGFLSQSDKSDDITTRTPLEHQIHHDKQAPLQESHSHFLQDFRELLTKYNNSDVTQYLDRLGVKNIDYIVSTHPHFDHLGGLLQVINKYTYQHVYYNGREYHTSYYKYFKMLVDDNVKLGKTATGLEIPQQNDTFRLGQAKVTILSDQTKDYSTISGDGDETNNSSLVIRLDYGERSFLFTGDIQVTGQRQLIENYPQLLSNINVLKIPHHGHTNNDFQVWEHSGNYAFFNQVQPVLSLISCGTNNTSVTIPTNKVKNDLSMSDIYTTKDLGTVVLSCDGSHISIQYQTSFIHAFVKGDINGDGKVTPADYVLIRRQILNTYHLKGNGKWCADINGDGKITPADYVLARRHILGTYQIN